MWLKSIDLLLMKMLEDNVDLSQIIRVGGTAQQHGSVYWKKAAEVTLAHLDPEYTLADQLQVILF